MNFAVIECRSYVGRGKLNMVGWREYRPFHFTQATTTLCSLVKILLVMPVKKAKAEKEKEEYFEVEKVLQAKVRSKKKRNIQWDYLVKWLGYNAKQNTWEPEASLQRAPEAVRAFWRDAEVDGRDHLNYKDFKPEDVVSLRSKGKKPTKLSASAKAKLKELEKTPTKSPKARGTPSKTSATRGSSANLKGKSTSARAKTTRSSPRRGRT